MENDFYIKARSSDQFIKIENELKKLSNIILNQIIEVVETKNWIECTMNAYPTSNGKYAIALPNSIEKITPDGQDFIIVYDKNFKFKIIKPKDPLEYIIISNDNEHVCINDETHNITKLTIKIPF